ncbi:DUF447 domain-containing protein [Haladaptatus caseinilyticus]|uniref:DUF447 domain-containing protein n=1 Tax=Haladaptatus caseinilyticus TaxID=2993314 RepID=UPI00224B0141|nr:DUF447 domain-containing protein [Haladaptatus caseinilyticus]
MELQGVTESIITTLGPNDLWNVAALGLHAGDSVTAKTWGNTRTRRNFHRQGGGVVQFTRDPVDFVEATLSIREESKPVLDSADAWVEVEVQPIDSGNSGETNWEEWELTPVSSEIVDERVPITNRGFSAIVEATVAVSRLDVDAYDTAELRARLTYFEDVVQRCGGPREQTAFERIYELAEW